LEKQRKAKKAIQRMEKVRLASRNGVEILALKTREVLRNKKVWFEKIGGGFKVINLY